MPLRYDFMLYRQKGILFPVMFPTTLKQNMFVRDQAYVVSTCYCNVCGTIWCDVLQSRQMQHGRACAVSAFYTQIKQSL